MIMIIRLFTAFIFLMTLCGASPRGHRVTFVYDGDTVRLETGAQIRYVGIDCPEMNFRTRDPEFMAREAREFNEDTVLGKIVRLESDEEKSDRYGRTLAYVSLEKGPMVNTLLVEKGLAVVMPTGSNLRHYKELKRAQQRAMDARRGIWSRPLSRTRGPFAASKRSHRFHRPGCPYAARIHPRNKILFKGLREAFYEGYYPCSHCNPEKH